MTTLLPVIGLIFAAAVTPGPNNFIVLEAGARSGLLAAGRAIAGVLIGSLLLLSFVWTGVGSLMRAAPVAQVVLSLAGGLYLGWLGAAMLAAGSGGAEHAAPQRLPSSLLGVAAFQLLNPKAWVLVTTAAAAVSGSGDVLTLGALMVGVTGLCLTLWGLAGHALRRLLGAPRQRLWFDRAMGALLSLSAIGLVVDALA